MGELFVPTSIALVLTVFNGDGDFLLDFRFQLNFKHVQGMDTVVVKPRLGDIEIDDCLSEIF